MTAAITPHAPAPATMAAPVAPTEAPAMALQALTDGADFASSPTVAQLAAALAGAQADIGNPAKNAANPHFKSRYADLAAVLSVARPALSENGLSIVQVPILDAPEMHLITVLLHSSGEWIGARLRHGLAGDQRGTTPVQQLGSLITYLRRYSAAAIVGVAQEDDDGEGTRTGNGNGDRNQPKAMAKQRARIDAVLNDLTPVQVEWVERHAAAAQDPGSLAAVAAKAEQAAKANQPAAKAPPVSQTDGALIARAWKIEETSEGNPVWGAILDVPPSTIPPGTRIKVQVGKGKHKPVIIREHVERVEEGVVLRVEDEKRGGK